jgi:outer membrane lipoprotein-sorting protein
MHPIVLRRRSERALLLCALAAVTFLVSAPTKAQNKYDVLARALQPYTSLFNARSPIKAMQTEVVLRQSSVGEPGLFVDQPARISLQMPDKLRVETLDPGRKIILCRDQQSVWVYPKELADRLINEAGPPGPPTVLEDFRLPLKDQQLVLVVALFQIVRFDTVASRKGGPAWDLDVRLAPELAPNAKDWVASAVIRQNDFQLEQLSIQAPHYNEKVQVLSTEFVPSLPLNFFLPEMDGATEIPNSLLRPILSKFSWIIGMR